MSISSNERVSDCDDRECRWHRGQPEAYEWDGSHWRGRPPPPKPIWASKVINPEELQKRLDVARARRHRYYIAHKDELNEDKKKYNRVAVQEARTFLGGKCQLCSSTENLHFCHVVYKTRSRGLLRAPMVARDVMKNPGDYLLLCSDCHFHPEKYLKELIEIRKGKS